MQYVWFIWSLIILALWAIIYLYNKEVRKQMLKMSLITMPFGFTEPLFVPEYWYPPYLLNLAESTGFDMESFIFSFAIGGDPILPTGFKREDMGRRIIVHSALPCLFREYPSVLSPIRRVVLESGQSDPYTFFLGFLLKSSFLHSHLVCTGLGYMSIYIGEQLKKLN